MTTRLIGAADNHHHQQQQKPVAHPIQAPPSHKPESVQFEPSAVPIIPVMPVVAAPVPAPAIAAPAPTGDAVISPIPAVQKPAPVHITDDAVQYILIKIKSADV